MMLMGMEQGIKIPHLLRDVGSISINNQEGQNLSGLKTKVASGKYMQAGSWYRKIRISASWTR